MAYQSFTHQIWWVMVCYDLAHQIRCAKHTFSGRCDITPMVCCSFGGHSTPQFLQCMKPRQIDPSLMVWTQGPSPCCSFFTKKNHTFVAYSRFKMILCTSNIHIARHTQKRDKWAYHLNLDGYRVFSSCMCRVFDSCS